MIRITSPATIKYNCVAWAAKDTERCWWPEEDYYWPKEIPMEYTVDCFAETFALLGYERCQNTDFEDGYCKIAIFSNEEGNPTHVARQRKNGLWTSKLGPLVDIEHDLETDLRTDLCLSSYGKVDVIMRRQFCDHA